MHHRSLALLAVAAACGPTYVVKHGRISMMNTDVPALPDARIYSDDLGEGLVTAVAANPAAQERARVYRDRTRTGLVLSLIGVTCAAADGLYAAQASESKPVGEMVVLTGCVVPLLVGSFLALSGLPYANDAMNIYNGYPSPAQLGSVTPR